MTIEHPRVVIEFTNDRTFRRTSVLSIRSGGHGGGGGFRSGSRRRLPPHVGRSSAGSHSFVLSFGPASLVVDSVGVLGIVWPLRLILEHGRRQVRVVAGVHAQRGEAFVVPFLLGAHPWNQSDVLEVTSVAETDTIVIYSSCEDESEYGEVNDRERGAGVPGTFQIR